MAVEDIGLADPQAWRSATPPGPLNFLRFFSRGELLYPARPGGDLSFANRAENPNARLPRGRLGAAGRCRVGPEGKPVPACCRPKTKYPEIFRPPTKTDESSERAYGASGLRNTDHEHTGIAILLPDRDYFPGKHWGRPQDFPYDPGPEYRGPFSSAKEFPAPSRGLGLLGRSLRPGSGGGPEAGKKIK